MKKYYAVRKGFESGLVVNNWVDCFKLVNGCKGAIYKGFDNEDEAIDFATASMSMKEVRRTFKPDAKRNKETLNERFNRLNPCTERKSYTDPFTGEYYKNRCVKRKHPKVLTGINYKPSNDTSIPWD